MELVWVEKESPNLPVNVDIISNTNEVLIHKNIQEKSSNGQIFYSYYELSLLFATSK